MSLEQEIFERYEQVDLEPVSAFGRACFCKPLTGREFGMLQKVCLEYGSNGDGKPKTNSELLKAAVCVLSLHDQNKQRIFGFTDFENFKTKVEAVANLPEPELLKIYRIAAPLSGLEEDALEEAEKNSGTTPVNSGGTVSPENSAA